MIVFVEPTARSVSPSLSGVGVLNSSSTLLAPLNSELSYQDSPTLLEAITLFEKAGRFWGYGFHDSCWKLFLFKLSHSGIEDESEIVKSVFELFYNTECRAYSVLSFAHNYGPARATQRLNRNPWRRTATPSMSFISDPCSLPSPRELLSWAPVIPNSTALKHFVLPNLNTGSARGPKNYICKLPLEVFHLILHILPLADVANFRVVCQDFSLMTEPESLPQAFWRTRFMAGFEMDYFPVTTSTTNDWLRLFSSSLTCGKGRHTSLANRKRIWGLLQYMGKSVV